MPGKTAIEAARDADLALTAGFHAMANQHSVCLNVSPSYLYVRMRADKIGHKKWLIGSISPVASEIASENTGY
ncbi:hypothetical protein [Paenibacillus cymbidii]|uniref:hypothetical protein n=1 Tax=Paenibacillus cymbidii TaxID=1639034 RepID=UPI001081AF21|nr:hypothetical protein [Paenibacillus cymbidii]